MNNFCDEKCNECELLNSKNSRMLSLVLATLDHAFYGTIDIVNKLCPNLTCCADCHVDDFSHYDGCEIDKEARKIADNWLASQNDE